MELIGSQRTLRIPDMALDPPALVRVCGDDAALNAAAALAWLGFPREDLATTGYRARPSAAGPAPDPGGSHYLTPHFRWEVSGFWPTVAQELALGQRTGTDARLAAILRDLRLEPLLDRNPLKLSGGETAKVVLAAHLARRPRRLVLDRVLGELDADTRALAMARLRDWVPGGIVFVTDEAVTDGFDATLLTDADTAQWSPGPRHPAGAEDPGAAAEALSLETRSRHAPSPRTALRLRRFAALRDRIPVFAPLHLEARSGDLVLLRGPNGCGKTSLLEAACGLLESQGERAVERDGRPLRLLEAWAYSPQDPLADITEATMEGELALACGDRAAGASRQALSGAASGVLDALGIPGAWSRAPLHEDVGLQKLASVIAATVRGRPVCLLDEPTIYLARPMRAAVYRALRRFLDGGGIALCATHDAELPHSLP